MLYSIQNSTGRVYGIFHVPPTTKSAEGIAHELKGELDGMLGINGVRDSPLYTSATESFEDRVVIDILASPMTEDERVILVHETVGRIALSTPKE